LPHQRPDFDPKTFTNPEPPPVIDEMAEEAHGGSMKRPGQSRHVEDVKEQQPSKPKSETIKGDFH